MEQKQGPQWSIMGFGITGSEILVKDYRSLFIYRVPLSAWGFPGGASGKESACQHKRRGFHPWVRKIFWRRKWQSTPVLLPGKSHGQRSLAGYSSAAAAKSFQSCPTLCDPIDGSPPGSPVPGIPQARTLEWVAISFSNA